VGLQGQVSLLSITTDPAIDTPSVLKEYGRRSGADFSFWAFLTGTSEQITQVWEGFGVVAVSRARGDVDHTSMTFLLDRTGRIRLIYLGYGWREEDMVTQMTKLLGEG
jgi:protein SCO1/2